MRRRFFVERFEGRRAELRGETAEHLGRVLRAEPGQIYELSDGEKVWLGRIEKISRARGNGASIEFSLVEPIAAEDSGLRIRLLLSIIKFDRMEWCLEKAAELGVTEILPLAAARSEKPLVQAASKRAARWRKILSESAQQARRLRPPELLEPARPAEVFANSDGSWKLLLSERKGAPRLREIFGSEPREVVCLAIGPEGGWTDEEFALAKKSDFQEVSLGSGILRAETAVISALAILRFELEQPGSGAANPSTA